jgi:hypothetical protein
MLGFQIMPLYVSTNSVTYIKHFEKILVFHSYVWQAAVRALCLAVDRWLKLKINANFAVKCTTTVVPSIGSSLNFASKLYREEVAEARRNNNSLVSKI